MTNESYENHIYYSRYGGLWVDRHDAHDVLARKKAEGEIDEEMARHFEHFINEGYVIFPRAVSNELIDEYLSMFEQAWQSPPPGIYAHCERKVLPLSKDMYDKVAKVSDLHYYFPRAHEIIFPEPVRRFLTLVYDRPPVVFQTMSMRKGTEEQLHTDTGPLTLTEPVALTASWLALEDVDLRAGALEYIPGSHHIEVLVNGVSKAHQGDYVAYGKALAEIRQRCAENGLQTVQFTAQKGDVLIWAADLMHGGAVIEDSTLTRKSLVCHFMPLGAMPTFYDFSKVNYVPYPNGTYSLDRITPRSEEISDTQPAIANSTASDIATDDKRMLPLVWRRVRRWIGL
ncbi:MAG: phytanoyl-CoA dioxygenase family protein [Nitrosomonas sp.]|nr:phytanoyl-CoA dioxygenase family protein [Nitrosomonas sp.]